MQGFQAERQRIAAELTAAQADETRLLADLEQLSTNITRVRARIASLQAEDHTYASAAGNQLTVVGNSDLSHMTIREAILTVLTEAKPELVRVRDLDHRLAARGKKVQGGPSVDLTQMKQAGLVLNPKWGYWTVP